MKKAKLLLSLSSVALLAGLTGCGAVKGAEYKPGTPVKVGLICLHDTNSTYDANFINALKQAVSALGDQKVVFTDDCLLTGVAEDEHCYDAAKDLVKKFKTLDSLYNASVDDFLSINGIGDILAVSLYEFFQKDTNRILISDLLALGLKIEEKEEIQGVFTGMRVVLTGSLVNYKRSQAQKLIEDNGGEVAASVSKDVNLVVVGSDAGSKLDKAKKLGIKTITEEEFIEMLPKTTLF